MGECLISRRGGESYELPILNGSYPQDVTITTFTGQSVTCEVNIATHGKPATYTYQWYVNDKAVNGATNWSYTKTDLNYESTYKIYCVVTNKAGSVISRVATIAITDIAPYYLITNGRANVSFDSKPGGSGQVAFEQGSNYLCFKPAGWANYNDTLSAGVDFTKYSTLHVTMCNPTSNGNAYFIVVNSAMGGVSQIKLDPPSSYPREYTVDIRSLSGLYYIWIRVEYQDEMGHSNIYVYNLYLD